MTLYVIPILRLHQGIIIIIDLKSTSLVCTYVKKLSNPSSDRSLGHRRAGVGGLCPPQSRPHRSREGGEGAAAGAARGGRRHQGPVHQASANNIAMGLHSINRLNNGD